MSLKYEHASEPLHISVKKSDLYGGTDAIEVALGLRVLARLAPPHHPPVRRLPAVLD